jgi:hypothetical protein
LDEAIKNADQVLGVAESSGMEVSEARLGQDQARDSLTKARVTIHSFRTDLIDQDIRAGLQIAAKNLQAGKEAMVERNHRRVGLGMSLIAIGIVLVGLRLYIRKIERWALHRKKSCIGTGRSAKMLDHLRELSAANLGCAQQHRSHLCRLGRERSGIRSA